MNDDMGILLMVVEGCKVYSIQKTYYTRLDYYVKYSHGKMYGDINLLRRVIVLFSALSIILVSLIAGYIALDFINPINSLVEAMRKLEHGDVSVELNLIEQMNWDFKKSFNKMAKEISHLVNRVYREQLIRKDAEIKALQSNKSPFFV